jgi:hypothetical protein
MALQPKHRHRPVCRLIRHEGAASERTDYLRLRCVLGLRQFCRQNVFKYLRVRVTASHVTHRA